MIGNWFNCASGTLSLGALQKLMLCKCSQSTYRQLRHNSWWFLRKLLDAVWRKGEIRVRTCMKKWPARNKVTHNTVIKNWNRSLSPSLSRIQFKSVVSDLSYLEVMWWIVSRLLEVHTPSCYRKGIRYLAFVAATDFRQALSWGCEAVSWLQFPTFTRIIPCTDQNLSWCCAHALCCHIRTLHSLDRL